MNNSEQDECDREFKENEWDDHIHVFLRVEFENKHEEAVLSIEESNIPLYPVAFTEYLCVK